MINRGVYLVIYTGEGQEDDAKKPGWLWLGKNSCKFGQSLGLKNVHKRYRTHLKGNCKLVIAGVFKDRDDIDAIEKQLHYKFASFRLINKNGRPSEWMKPISNNDLVNGFYEVVKAHFSLL